MPHTSSQAFLRELDKKLWTAADRLRSNLDAAVYKHAVLGLIFLKYVSDSFAQRQAEIEAMLKDPENDFFVDSDSYEKPKASKGRDTGIPACSSAYEEAIHRELEEHYYIKKNVFWVPALARWKTLQDSAKLPAGTEILGEHTRLACSDGRPASRSSSSKPYKITSTGKLIDDALEAVEKENPNGAERHRRPSNVARRVRAGARIKLKNVHVASVCDRRTLKSSIAGRRPIDQRINRRRTKLRKTSDGRRPTLQLQIDPANLVRLAPAKPLGDAGLIDLIATIPFQHADRNPSRQSGAATNAKGILGHNTEFHRPNSISASLCDLCAFAVQISSPRMATGMSPLPDTFTRDQHPDLRADFVMALPSAAARSLSRSRPADRPNGRINPPFNIKEWWDGKLEGDARWNRSKAALASRTKLYKNRGENGTPPQRNANFVWVQHMLHHLAPNGSMALLLANGSMSSENPTEPTRNIPAPSVSQKLGLDASVFLN